MPYCAPRGGSGSGALPELALGLLDPAHLAEGRVQVAEGGAHRLRRTLAALPGPPSRTAPASSSRRSASSRAGRNAGGIGSMGDRVRGPKPTSSAGKIRYVGCSNFSGWHLMKSLAVAERYNLPRYVAHQAYYSLIGRDYEWELMPLGLDQGVGAVVWSPLGWGRLTGKIGRGKPIPPGSRLHKTAEMGPQVADEYLYQVVDALEVVAAEVERSVPQVALNWLLQRPTVANVIVGARNEEQLRQNLGAVGWTLTAEQVRRLDQASEQPKTYPYWHQAGFAERNPPPVG